MEPYISVIIATKNRPIFLNRALSSILSQKYTNLEIIIVNDSDEKYEKRNQNVIQQFTRKIDIKVLKAPESGNPCISWNKAAKEAKGEFLAFLDDDDEWLPDYLKKCIKQQKNDDLDLVLAGFWRKKRKKLKPDFLPPNRLLADLLYVQNIGLRTSNLFIKKVVFLKVGGFNESLLTSTDRGLSIKLANYSNLKYQPLKERLVIYNKHKKGQMISAKHPTRYIGTKIFYELFNKKMTEMEKKFFLYRVWKFWGWNLFDNYNIKPFLLSTKRLTLKLQNMIFFWIDRESNTDKLDYYYNTTYKKYLQLLSQTNFSDKVISIWQEISRQYEKEYQLYHETSYRRPIIIGMVNTNRSESLKNFINSFLKEIYNFGLNYYFLSNSSKITIIVIDNSNNLTHKKQNKQLIELSKKIGINIKYFDIRDCLVEDFLIKKKGENTLFSIAESRRILTQKIIKMNFRKDSITWILDDCMQFGSLIINGEKQVKHLHVINSFHLLWYIAKNHKKKKIFIGNNTGTAPLPILSTINSQIRDLKRNIEFLIKEKPNEIYKQKQKLNLLYQKDYYHDFLNNKRQSFPYLLQKGTNKEILSDYLKKFLLILSGFPITRQLAITNYSEYKINRIKQKTILRGGNTIINDFEILINSLHPIPYFKGEPIRRSDFIWAIKRSNQNDACYKTPLIINKQKEINNDFSPTNLIKTLEKDLYGHCLYKMMLKQIKSNKTLARFFEKRRTKIRKVLTESLENIEVIEQNITNADYWIRNEIDANILEKITLFIINLRELFHEAINTINQLKVPCLNDYSISMESEINNKRKRN